MRGTLNPCFAQNEAARSIGRELAMSFKIPRTLPFNIQMSVNVEMTVHVRAMIESDLPEARAILCLAFGTFPGVPNPETLWPDRDYVFTRWRANPGGR